MQSNLSSCGRGHGNSQGCAHARGAISRRHTRGNYAFWAQHLEGSQTSLRDPPGGCPIELAWKEPNRDLSMGPNLASAPSRLGGCLSEWDGENDDDADSDAAYDNADF